MKSFKGKVAAVTGAGSGIGRALARQLAAAGCHLALSDLNEQGLAETVALIGNASVKITQQKLDVSDRKAVYAWADKVKADHGNANLIFNNAGVALGSQIDGMSDDDFKWIMDINFWGVVYGTQAFLPQLKASGDGHVINISSIFGIIAVPSQAAYNASKFAVRGFTEALRQELEIAGEPVSSTTVHPGGIKTNIAKSARWGGNMTSFIGKTAEQGSADFEKLFKTTPDQAAATILKAVQRNARRVLIGLDAHAVDWMQRLLPTGYQKLVAAATKKQMKGRKQ